MPRPQALRLPIIMIFLVLGCSPQAQPTEPGNGAATALTYQAEFSASFTADSGIAVASITIDQNQALLKTLDFNAPNSAYQVLAFDGDLTHKNDRMLWRIPETGGTLTYEYRIDTPRGDQYDAKHTSTWTLLRLGDLFPSAKARARKGSMSESSVFMRGPRGWSFESRYGALHQVRKPLGHYERNFNRPTGWLLGGILGTRRDVIAGHDFVISGPVDGGMRRMDTLSFLNWTIPTLNSILPALPPHIFIVGAPQIMWRGGLSAPDSVYVHVDRPLVSENGTSTLLHELVHMAGIHSAAPGSDWIVEGLAEYYAMLILRRSGGLSAERFQATLDDLRDWVKKDLGRLSDPSSGANTAAAVLVLHQLANELEEHGAHMDTLLHKLLDAPEISLAAMIEITADLTGEPSQVLSKLGDQQ